MDYTLPPLTILLAMSDALRANDVATAIRENTNGKPPDVLYAGTLADAIDRLKEQRIDITLLDLSLPDAFGLDAVEHLLTEIVDVPIVVLVDQAQEHLARQAVSAGAQDYLLGTELDRRTLHRVIRNAVERQRLLAQERASRAIAEQARRARDEVFAVVSHDLRAPLNAISMCARGLIEPGADHAELGRTILQAAEWSRRVIRDLLDVVAIDRGQFQVVPHETDICLVARAACDLFRQTAESRGVVLEVRCPEGPVSAMVDSDRLQQAIDNLVDNALRATATGGQIVVEATGDPVGYVSVRVRDTGCGISEARQAVLFERGMRRIVRGGGSGLGLTIVKAFSELHGGSVSVESQVGVGSTFTIRLPRHGP